MKEILGIFMLAMCCAVLLMPFLLFAIGFVDGGFKGGLRAVRELFDDPLYYLVVPRRPPK